MANNRIYIRCKVCGDTLFLGKSFMSGYFYENYDKPSLEIKLNEFYDKHTYCSAEKVSNTPYEGNDYPLLTEEISCDGAFDIVYENSPF